MSDFIFDLTTAASGVRMRTPLLCWELLGAAANLAAVNLTATDLAVSDAAVVPTPRWERVFLLNLILPREVLPEGAAGEAMPVLLITPEWVGVLLIWCVLRVELEEEMESWLPYRSYWRPILT